MDTVSANACLPADLELPELKASDRRHWRAGTLVYSTGGLVILFCWLLLGDFAWSLKERSVFAVLQLMFKNLGASDTLNAIFISAVPGLIGLILGPIISYNSDRHRGSWGRRIPYLVVTTPIAALAMVGLALSPILGNFFHPLLGVNSPGLNNTILYLLAFFWVVFEVCTIAANAVFIALINDVVPDRFLGRFFGLFRMLSILAGIIFNLWLIGNAEKYFMWIFIGFGLIYFVGFSFMCLNVKEGEYPPVPASEFKKSVFSGASVYFRECFSNRYYIGIFAALAIAGMSIIPVNLFSIFHAKSLSINMSDYGRILATTFVISLCISWFLGALADRFHPLRTGMAVLFLYAVSAVFSGFFIHDAVTFGIGFMVHVVVSGMYVTSIASLMQRLFPKERFAQFASAAGIVASLSSIIMAPLIGKLLDTQAHNYNLTYFVGALFSTLGLFSFWWVYRRFMQLGGHTDYHAPSVSVP